MANTAIASQKEQLVLIYFSADWCGPCQTLGPILKAVKKHFGDKVNLITVNVDNNVPLVKSFSIQHIPTLLLYKEEQQLWRRSRLLTRAELITVIQQYLDKCYL